MYSIEKRRAWRARNAEADPDWGRKRHLKERYGITLDQYNDMLDAQGGGCAICGADKNLRVDHNHATGNVRGILCHRCNVGLPIVEEPERLAAAHSYLEGAA